MTVTIPEKTWFKIGEVAAIVGVKPYILRYWESEFRAIRPAKTKSRQRLYRKKDIELLLVIRALVHDQRYTVDGARRQLKELAANQAEFARLVREAMQRDDRGAEPVTLAAEEDGGWDDIEAALLDEDAPAQGELPIDAGAVELRIPRPTTDAPPGPRLASRALAQQTELIQTLRQELEQVRAKVEGIERERAEAVALAGRLEQRAQVAEAASAADRAELVALRAARDTDHAELRAMRAAAEASASELAALRALASTADRDHADLSALRETLEQVEAERVELAGQLAEETMRLVAERDDALAAVERLQARLDHLATAAETPTPVDPEAARQRDALASEVARLEGERERYTERIEDLESGRLALERALGDARADVARLRAAVDEANTRASSQATVDVDAFRSELAEAREENAALRAAMARRWRALLRHVAAD